MFRKIIFIFVALFITISLQAKEKYAMGLFHYNLQYVAGDYRIESRIIRESLYPALQWFERHPEYKSDFEIQGYAIEVLAEDHPEVFKLFKKLVDRGQIELVIAHYSDQFFIAYPALDLRKSIEISDEILKKYDLKRSRVFFAQELQWSPALAWALQGKYDVVVTSSDPHAYYRGYTLPLVHSNYDGKTILAFIGAGEKKLKNVEWTWAFLDDGEVFNTLDYNSDFYRVPEQEKKNKEHYKKLYDEGYKIVTISEFVDVLKRDKDYKISDYPFVPEGTWNMSVCGPFMWMGRQRSGVERDGQTRAVSYKLRGNILLAEKLIDQAEKGGKDVTLLRKLLREAWIHLLLSEVSDSSGWTPWLVEVQYTDNEAASAMQKLKKIFKVLADDLNLDDEEWLVNTNTGLIKKVDDIVVDKKDVLLPLNPAVRAASYTIDAKKIGDDLYRIDISCTRPQDGAVEIVFETADKGLFYSAGCGEEAMAAIPLDLKHDPAFSLSNGFIYLGNGYNLIKDCSVEHIAATWKQKNKKLVFRQELNENNPGMKMRFYILKGRPRAGLELANRLNTWPSYMVKKEEGKLKFEKVLPEANVKFD